MARTRSSKKGSDITSSGAESTAATPVAKAEPVKAESLQAVAAETAKPEKKATARRTARKPEIVKKESRHNLVSINLEQEIRQLAYLLSERRGFVPGYEAEDWLSAEHEVRRRYQHQSAATA